MKISWLENAIDNQVESWPPHWLEDKRCGAWELNGQSMYGSVSTHESYEGEGGVGTWKEDWADCFWGQAMYSHHQLLDTFLCGVTHYTLYNACGEWHVYFMCHRMDWKPPRCVMSSESLQRDSRQLEPTHKYERSLFKWKVTNPFHAPRHLITW